MRIFLCIGLLAMSGVLHAQKPITLIIPFPPGGSTDIVGRIAAEGLAKELGQPVVVDNRGGAGGAIGAKAIAEAAADGYTLGVATVSTHVVNPVVRGAALGYDALKDFTYITQIAAVPNVVSVHPSVPARSMEEFIAFLRQNPGRLNFGTPGNGSLGHLIGETFKHAAKVDMVHVPYKGGGPALTDALAGQVQVLFDNLPSSLPHIQSGKLRALAVASDKRVAALPEVPTFAETGLPQVNDPSWFGLIGPARLPPALVVRVGDALARAVRQPEAAGRLAAVAATPIANTPDQFREVVAASIAASRRIANENRLKFD
jgi:tripartite-type tricarboxylate transporter receptor subunit TctC